MNQISKFLLSLFVIGYLLYIAIEGINSLLGIEYCLIIGSILLIIFCLGTAVRAYKAAFWLERLFMGESITYFNKKNTNIDLTYFLTKKVATPISFIPSIAFGKRTYKYDEILVIYIFFMLVVIGFTLLINMTL